MVGELGKEVSEGAVAPVEERTLERSWDVFPKMGGGVDRKLSAGQVRLCMQQKVVGRFM